MNAGEMCLVDISVDLYQYISLCEIPLQGEAGCWRLNNGAVV